MDLTDTTVSHLFKSIIRSFIDVCAWKTVHGQFYLFGCCSSVIQSVFVLFSSLLTV